MHITRNDNIGAAVSVAIHVLLLLLFLFITMRTEPPADSGGGMMIDLGISLDGSGNNPSGMHSGSVPTTPSQRQPVSDAASSAGQNAPQSTQALKSAHTDEPSLEEKNKQRPKPFNPAPVPTQAQAEPIRPAPTPAEPQRPRINQQALFPGASGGQGPGARPGNVGDPSGMPGGGQGGAGNQPFSQGTGTGSGGANQPGQSNGPGFRIELTGRTPRQIFKPDYDVQEEGRVVVKISVDKQGNVVAATTDGVRGSTTTNQALHQKAIEAARKCKFDVKPDAQPIQVGYITYNFILSN